MTYKTVLVVAGADLMDEDTVIKLASLSDLSWSSVDGRVTATVFTETADPVAHVIDSAHLIEHALPDVRVERVDEEFVSLSDIASRVGVARETVRLWSLGRRGPKGFPLMRGSVGGGERGGVKIWCWADVNAWLAKHYELGDDYAYLTSAQVAEVNAHLERVDHEFDKQWQVAATATSSEIRVATGVYAAKASSVIMQHKLIGKKFAPQAALSGVRVAGYSSGSTKSS